MNKVFIKDMATWGKMMSESSRLFQFVKRRGAQFLVEKLQFALKTNCLCSFRIYLR
jgi:hypothetical protein